MRILSVSFNFILHQGVENENFSQLKLGQHFASKTEKY